MVTRRKTVKRKPVQRRSTTNKYVVTVKQTLTSVPLSKTMADNLKAKVKKKSPGAVVTTRKV